MECSYLLATPSEFACHVAGVNENARVVPNTGAKSLFGAHKARQERSQYTYMPFYRLEDFSIGLYDRRTRCSLCSLEAGIK
jgi:hypothetical protein